jgi:large subunit ribosomal protein L34e
MISVNNRGTKRRLKKIRVAVRTPGGRLIYHYKHKKHSYAVCSCGARLNSTPTGPRFVISKIPLSQRRPKRPYGGNLCPRCMRRLMITSAVSEGLALLAS